MPKYTTLLVGAHFRPPAKQVLGHLGAGTELVVEREDDNPYDQFAVKVFVDPGLIPDSEFPALELELPEAGVTLEQLMSGGPIWLGYIPATQGKPLAKARLIEPGLIGNEEVRGLMDGEGGVKVRLAFDLDGTPRATVETGELSEGVVDVDVDENQ